MSQSTRPRIAVVGASGYAGGETLRLLATHPDIEVGALTAHSSAGKHLSEVMPHLDLGDDPIIQDTTVENLRGHDAVVIALPHGQSGALAAELQKDAPDTLVIDLGADHRLERADDWTAYYGTEHAGTWTYGMPELPRADGTSQRSELATTRRIAVPGCNATAVTLAFAPLIAHQLIDPTQLQAVLPVGYTGAGRTPKQHLLYAEAAGGASPYAVGGTHRHIPEILQNLRHAGGPEHARLTFVPVLVPMNRGILAVCTAPTVGNLTTDALLGALQDTYREEHFIQVLPEGRMPTTAEVAGANVAKIGAVVDRHSGQAAVLCAIDNLMKGTAGAAIQSLNLALGIEETTGLSRTGLAP